MIQDLKAVATHWIWCSSFMVYFKKLSTSESRRRWPQSYNTIFILHAYQSNEENNFQKKIIKWTETATFAICCSTISNYYKLLTSIPYISSGILFCRSTKLICCSNNFNDIGLWLHKLINTDKAIDLILQSFCNKIRCSVHINLTIKKAKNKTLTLSVSLHKISTQNFRTFSKYGWCNLIEMPNETSWINFNACSTRIPGRNKRSASIGTNWIRCSKFCRSFNASIIFSISSTAFPNGPM